jgi:hypothetical protein
MLKCRVNRLDSHGNYVLLTMVNVAIFWDIVHCSPYVNWCFRGTYHLRLLGRESAEEETSLQQVARQNFPRNASSWTTRRHIPENGNIHNYRCDNLKSYVLEMVFRYLISFPVFYFKILFISQFCKIINKLYHLLLQWKGSQVPTS